MQVQIKPATGGDRLSATFLALADPTRRSILKTLASGERTLTELAEPFAMSVPAVTKHLRILERAGLITKSRQAQRKPCAVKLEPLNEAASWLAEYRLEWEQRLDRLEAFVIGLEARSRSENSKQSKTKKKV